MRNLLRTLAAAIAGLTPFWAVPAFAQEDTIEWLDNYEKAVQEARRTHKPIFLEFRCEA